MVAGLKNTSVEGMKIKMNNNDLIEVLDEISANDTLASIHISRDNSFTAQAYLSEIQNKIQMIKKTLDNDIQ